MVDGVDGNVEIRVELYVGDIFRLCCGVISLRHNIPFTRVHKCSQYSGWFGISFRSADRSKEYDVFDEWIVFGVCGVVAADSLNKGQGISAEDIRKIMICIEFILSMWKPKTNRNTTMESNMKTFKIRNSNMTTEGRESLAHDTFGCFLYKDQFTHRRYKINKLQPHHRTKTTEPNEKRLSESNVRYYM